jgi:uncharacterized membrane protein YdjX (TVP38/TMEM64 family)
VAAGATGATVEPDRGGRPRNLGRRPDVASVVRPGNDLERRRAASRIGALAAAVAALFLAGVLTGGLSPATVTHAVHAAGPLAPVAFVGLGAALACVLFPGQVTATLAGALFGIGAGIGLALGSVALGGLCAFGIARLAGGASAQRLLGARAEACRDWVRRHGVHAVLASRLLPGAPAGVINYAAGLSGLRVLPFVAAVAVGAVPKTVAYVALGGALHDPLSPRGLIAVTLYLAATLAGVLLARRGLAGAGGMRRGGRAAPQPV